MKNKIYAVIIYYKDNKSVRRTFDDIQNVIPYLKNEFSDEIIHMSISIKEI